MKKLLFLSAIVFLNFSSYAQAEGTIKLYGFKQLVSGGRAPDIVAGTTTKTSNGAGRNYFIYAASSSRIYPSEMWIEGVRYGVSVRLIAKTPVEYSDEANVGSPKKVLVPKTSKKVIQLTPIPAMVSKSIPVKPQALAASNELVVLYKQNGKFYYAAIKALSGMVGAAMQ
jgi:hypothetical protein